MGPRTRTIVITVAVGAFSLAGLLPASAMTEPAATAQMPAAARAAQAASYNGKLTTDVQQARKQHRLRHYKTNARLDKIAQAWANHLATTGVLEHNPALFSKVNKACPRWTTFGENVGMSSDARPNVLYEAYMHSPPHRANILDHHYREVGIATTAVSVAGVTTYWNVMDFARGCPK